MLKGADFIALTFLTQKRTAGIDKEGRPLYSIVPVADPTGQRAPRTCERVADGYPTAQAASDALERLLASGKIRELLPEEAALFADAEPGPRRRRTRRERGSAEEPQPDSPTPSEEEV